MSSPAACARYQSAVHASDSAIPRLGRHPRARSASLDDNVRACASGGCTAAIAFPARLARKARAERIDHFVHRAKGCRIRPEIDSARRAVGRLHQRLRQREIPRERLEHMLPRPDGVRVAQRDRLARRERPDAVGNQPVGGPVAAADDVAGTGRRDRRPVAEKALAKAARQAVPRRPCCCCTDRGRRADHPPRTAGPRSPPLPRPLPASPPPSVILVDLVAGDDHHALERLEFPACLQQRAGPSTLVA